MGCTCWQGIRARIGKIERPDVKEMMEEMGEGEGEHEAGDRSKELGYKAIRETIPRRTVIMSQVFNLHHPRSQF